VALARYLRNGWTSGEQSIYRHTRRLPPGSFLVWQGGSLHTERFWKLEDRDEEPDPSFEQAVDRLEALLGDAVERRLIADVPLGAFLSGGVDSSTVVALMQERARGRVRTFSIGFEDARFDEAPHARAVAAHLQTEHTELYVTREQTIEAARDVADVYDEPFADSSAIPTLLLSRLTRNHVTVALSGDGGDELLGGYERYQQIAQFLPWLSLPSSLRRGLASVSGWVPSPRFRKALSMLAFADPADAVQQMTAHLPPAAIARAARNGEGRCEAFDRAYRASSHPDPLRRIMYGDAASYMTDDILAKVDRASMSVALEVRVPVIDHRVVRYALSLPRSIVWHGGRTKAPLRAILERRVPRALLERPKHGFGIPLHSLMPAELAAWKARYLDPKRIREEGVFDPDGVAELVRDTDDPRSRVAATRAWILLCFQRWYARTHLGEKDP
jgi:asparagine synthase (glutamine-hydrolysing)